MHMNCRIVIRLLLGVALLPASAAFASAIWTHVGAACTPDEASVNKVETSAARFRHAGNVTGDIFARCNVTNPKDDGGHPSWNYLEVVYFDPPGANQVTATLTAVSNRTGGIWTVASFDSDTTGVVVPTADALKKGVAFHHTFNFDENAYYVQLKVRREEAGAANNPAVSIVRLKQIIE